MAGKSIPGGLRREAAGKHVESRRLRDLVNFQLALDETAAVVATDLHGVITSANRRFCELTGFAENELVGETHRILSSGYHTREFYRELWETISAGRIWRGEIRNRHRSGRAYWSTMTIIPFCDSEGNPYRYVSVRSDISALKEAEADHLRLLDAQAKLNEAEEAVLSRDRFVSMAAHELKTPIAALKLRVELGLRKFAAGASGLPLEEQAKVLNGALSQAKRLTAMIDDMLDVSRISAGRLRLNHEKLNLVRLVDDVINQFHEDLRNQRIDVRVRAPEEVWACVDRARVEQVLINLLTNGMKYGEGKPIRISIAEDGARAVILVADEGRGMSEEFRARVFQRFARESEGGEVKGNGLGLWITSQIVKAHGGRIGVESEPNVGSTFRVELPLTADDAGTLTL